MDPRGSMSSDVQENSTSQSRRSAYLTTNHNDYSHLPFRDQPSLAQIRRVEDYIEGNWDQPQSIDALSVIVGVSARSLFQYFQKKRGYSPMVSSC
jgi:transcriptional regulator GlxA family with amidase domain